jgi:hypothetical protein
MTKIARLFTMDNPPPGERRTRPGADCGCSRTRDDELADQPGVVYSFKPSPEFDYRLEKSDSGLVTIVATRKTDAPDVMMTTGDASAKVELMNSRNRSFWGDRDVRPLSAPASDIPSWAKEMNDRAREFWAR